MKDRCPNCRSKDIKPKPDTEYVPISLVNPLLFGLMLPKEAYCPKCGTQFELVNEYTTEYNIINGRD